jgi:hypothetical protein
MANQSKSKMKKIVKKTFIAFLIIASILICLLYIALCNGFSGFNKTKNYYLPPEINYFHGVIVDENHKGLEGVNISNMNLPKITCKSDKKGYFELKDYKLNIKKRDSLILNNAEFITDTIETLEEKYSDKESSIIYRFSRKNIDTIIMVKSNKK